MTPARIDLALGVGMLPVLLFLAILVGMDSFRLVSWRRLLAAVGAGALAAVLAALASWSLLAASGWPVDGVARYLSPPLEEAIKLVYPLLLIRSRRVGFAVDAAIYGFAVGAGFAVVENVYYAVSFSGLSGWFWIVRGFGTGVMHGSCTATFAILAVTARVRRPAHFGVLAAAAWFAVTLVHGLYNRFLISPVLTSLLLTLGLPLVMALVYRRSEASLRRWLGEGFATDAEILRLTRAGQLGRSPVGRYLSALRIHFPGTTVADMYCLLALRAELALRAKGALMLREAGFLPSGRPDWQAKLTEIHHLEHVIGRTGRLALRPLSSPSHRDQWQLEFLNDA